VYAEKPKNRYTVPTFPFVVFLAIGKTAFVDRRDRGESIQRETRDDD
jgi:hypothetical protein